MSDARRGLPLHTKILTGLVLGAVAGIIAQKTLGADNEGLKTAVEAYARPVGKIFLNMIFMIVVPLLFSALVLGVAEIGDARKVGKVGVLALVMTLLLSGIAVGIGILSVNMVRPGDGITAEQRTNLMSRYGKAADAQKSVEKAKEAKTGMDAILEIVPDNPLNSAVNALQGGLLPFMFFALVFGLALGMVDPARGLPVKQFLDGLFAVSLKVIDFAMAIAPVGVFALAFSTAAVLGADAILALGKYALLVLLALAFHQFVVYSFVIATVARRNPLEFFRQIKTVMITAFATSSSNATLPSALKAAEEDVGLPKDISRFVLTVGATANQNGTALFEGITVLFLAQLYGVPLDLSAQITVMFLAILAGVGTAGVPGGSWPMIAIILTKIGVPPEGIGICLGIDRILDMSRTVLNVSGDITIAACVSKLMGRQQAMPEFAAS
jgi:DAACS family dicarboxylate/amino acid:cation (Na+ or H+) symporter